MPRIKHLLFDNDGTIVDSEIIAVRSMLRMLATHGLHLSEREYCRKFPGLTLRDIIETLAKDYGVVLPETFWAESRAEHIRLFNLELRAVPGMYSLFRRLNTPKSMVSNGSVRHVERSLRKVRLFHALNGHIFSAEHVTRPKPFPDVYLHALKVLGIRASEVLVVEDSPVGVRAAKQAGMHVIGFLGATHTYEGQADELRAEGADWIAPNATALREVLHKCGVE